MALNSQGRSGIQPGALDISTKEESIIAILLYPTCIVSLTLPTIPLKEVRKTVLKKKRKII